MKILPILFLLFISLATCAQGMYGVVKTHSFVSKSSPGTIAVDDNGVQIQRIITTYSIFLETNNRNTPVWKTAWVNGKTFNVLSTIMASPHIAGMKNDVDEQVTITTAKGNRLLQLNLEKKNALKAPATYKKQLAAKKILVEGLYNGKKVYLVVNKPQLLRGVEYQ